MCDCWRSLLCHALIRVSAQRLCLLTDLVMAQGATQAEWKEAHGSSLLLGQKAGDLEEHMGRSACVLVMEYIPGRPLLGEQEPFQATQILRTAEDLGR